MMMTKMTTIITVIDSNLKNGITICRDNDNNVYELSMGLSEDKNKPRSK